MAVHCHHCKWASCRPEDQDEQRLPHAAAILSRLHALPPSPPTLSSTSAATCRPARRAQNFAEQLSRRALQELLEAATGSPAGLTAQGDRQRSLGGQFIKLAKKRLHDEKIRYMPGMLWGQSGLEECVRCTEEA